MNLKNIALASVAAGGFILLSAFGGNKATLADQMKAIDAAVSENVEAYEIQKRAECKAMALQKAIGIADAKLAAASGNVGAKNSLVAAKTVVKAPTKTTTKTTTKPTVPAVKPATPAPAPTPAPTTGRRQETPTPATPAPSSNTPTTGRRGQ